MKEELTLYLKSIIMIDLNYISGFYANAISENTSFAKHMVKEYIQLMVLDYLSTTPYIKKLAFIGGTNLRLVKGIDRWSEDLDFDCKVMSDEEFKEMTDSIITYLQRNGLNAIAKDKDNSRLTAFRRSIHFPELLFELKLTGHREERFLLKIEAQDQGVDYTPVVANVNGCGFFFQLPIPPDGVLLAMKLSALLTRAKGRDFYDVMFLMSQTEPDYNFLSKRIGVSNLLELKAAINAVISKIDLNIKKKDFEHLLFRSENCDKILRFPEFIDGMK